MNVHSARITTLGERVEDIFYVTNTEAEPIVDQSTIKKLETTIREALCAAGRFGQKAGKGFYDYDEARNRTPSDEVKQIIADFAAQEGKPQRAISKDEIRERLLYPMVNEGAEILDEGMAQRASDIDVVWINGYGWPLYTGGPMFWAQTIGLDTVVAGLEQHGLPVSSYLRARAEDSGKFA